MPTLAWGGGRSLGCLVERRSAAVEPSTPEGSLFPLPPSPLSTGRAHRAERVGPSGRGRPGTPRRGRRRGPGRRGPPRRPPGRDRSPRRRRQGARSQPLGLRSGSRLMVLPPPRWWGPLGVRELGPEARPWVGVPARRPACGGRRGGGRRGQCFTVGLHQSCVSRECPHPAWTRLSFSCPNPSFDEAKAGKAPPSPLPP